MSQLDPDQYTVVWFAPLEVEVHAALRMLDDRHDGHFPVAPGDDFVYLAGEMCNHNIVIASFPHGQEYGTGAAAALASQVKRFFPNLWFGLLVGVAAGLPNLDTQPQRDIRLGDVLVASRSGDFPAVVAYDLGKATDNGFQLLYNGGVLSRTESIVASAISNIRIHTTDDTNSFSLSDYQAEVLEEQQRNDKFAYPGHDKDRLFPAHTDAQEQTVHRPLRSNPGRPRVWYGPIGSGEKLMRNAQEKNALRDKYDLIGLEMEAAGIMNRVPVGVIRGVCDYGDSYKNKDWQPFAAITAAAYAKGLWNLNIPGIRDEIRGLTGDDNEVLRNRVANLRNRPPTSHF
ncbi:putative nacht and wd domain protein [Colletotrichum karsti]|uniref:Nacht and wd domain protein n=1 Tax=Colletotrichum karsti TaxID=1095194 RepID=A0A9P6LGZ7_9PEZI|nr:putative nacht and wd domain protein [Colletotrichum karsti]KAF9872100.1 putative nacht and wd domain protein [Colletotrichum karsti]